MKLDEQPAKTVTLKLAEIGDHATGILCHVDNTRQARDIDGEPKTWDDGTPRQTKIVRLSITGGNGINSATDEPAEPGTVLAIFVEGGTFYEWRDAAETYGRDKLETGTKVRWEYIKDVKPSNPRHNPRKVKAFTFADATDATRKVADHEHAYIEQQLDTAAELAPPEPEPARTPLDNEDPF